MDRKTVTGLTDSELFAIKQKFFQNVPHPTLIIKYIKLLNPEKGDLIFTYEIDQDYLNISLEKALEIQISNEISIKLEIANSKNSAELKNSLMKLLKSHTSFIAKLSAHAAGINTSEIKISDPFPVYDMLKSLREKDIKLENIKSEILKHYSEENPKLDSLFENILKAKKIVANG